MLKYQFLVLPFYKKVLLLEVLNTRDIAAIATCSTICGVLNPVLAPISFRMFGLPFLCTIIGFSTLIMAAWWIRKPGAITLIGLTATLINFALGGSVEFLGFTAASIFFDLATRLTGYNYSSKKPTLLVVN
jgi:hypothetical protein